MNLQDYFKSISGGGLPADADAYGKVDMAIYSGPFFVKDDSLAFIMAEQLIREELHSDSRTRFFFIESGIWFSGNESI